MTDPGPAVETRSGITALLRESRAFIAFVVAIFLAQGLLLTGYKFFEQAAGGGASLTEQFVNEMSSPLVSLLLFPIIYWLCRRFPLEPGVWWKAVAAHAAALPAVSAAHTLGIWAARRVLYPVFGVDAVYGNLPVRLAQEFFADAWSYLIIITALYGFFYYRDTKRRQLDTARLQTELGRARLRDLRARLQPHFLFNTLNAISAHLRDDPAGAERMIEQLSALLRRSLAASGAQETSIAEEVDTLALYAGIMRERLGDRVRVEIDVEPGAETGSIPTLILQPLVENAIEHGLGGLARGGTVSVRVRRESGRLVVEVEDDGVGLGTEPSAALGSGFGLTSTVERLRALYGDAGRVELEPRDPGTLVRLTIPWRRTEVPEAPRVARARAVS
ncbi:MAG: histidine kinase [Gemmatimonadota bacterium]|nr:histidine kinase [Gemmatimonadota bacterium]